MVLDNIMRKMNVWYCHPYASAPNRGTGVPNRSYYLTEALAEQGCDVTVIGGSFDHLGGQKFRDNELKSKYIIERKNNVNSVWLKTPDYHGNGLRRIVNMLQYAFALRKYYKKIAKEVGKPDVIICSVQHPFHFSVTKRITRYFSAKLITEVRDLWPLSLMQILGMSKYHPLCFWLKRIEKRYCQDSDAVVSLLDNARDYFNDLGVQDKSYYCIPNGYVPVDLAADAVEATSSDLELLKTLKSEGNFIVGYTGAHGEPNDLEILCRAFLKLEALPIKLVLIGNGNVKSKLQEITQHASNIFFFDSKPKNEMRAFQHCFDVGYLGVKKLAIYSYGLSPNKMYEYMYNKLPILTGEFPKSELTKKVRCGIYFVNDSVGDLTATLESLCHMEKNKLLKIGERGREAIVKEYLYSDLARRYQDLFHRLLD